jgi:hypothetical protein
MGVTIKNLIWMFYLKIKLGLTQKMIGV